jgi:hypothetical protein
MASKAVEDAVDAYLAANWTACPIYTENQQGSVPDDGSAFITLQFPVANVERLSPSSRLYWEEGGFRILINVQRGAGTATIRDYGAQLATLFRDVTVGNIVHCLVPTEAFTDDQSDKGLYFTGTVVVPYTYTFHE